MTLVEYKEINHTKHLLYKTFMKDCVLQLYNLVQVQLSEKEILARIDDIEIILPTIDGSQEIMEHIFQKYCKNLSMHEKLEFGLV